VRRNASSSCKKILECGYKLIITDSNPDCYCFKLADEFVQKDTFDIENNLRIADSLKENYKIKGVVTVAADC